MCGFFFLFFLLGIYWLGNGCYRRWLFLASVCFWELLVCWFCIMAGVSVFSSSSIRLRVFWQCVVCFFVIFLERFLSLANHGEAPRTDNADAGEKSRFAKITPKKRRNKIRIMKIPTDTTRKPPFFLFSQ